MKIKRITFKFNKKNKFSYEKINEIADFIYKNIDDSVSALIILSPDVYTILQCARNKNNAFLVQKNKAINSLTSCIVKYDDEHEYMGMIDTYAINSKNGQEENLVIIRQDNGVIKIIEFKDILFKSTNDIKW